MAQAIDRGGGGLNFTMLSLLAGPSRHHLTCMHFIILYEVAYLPFAQSGGQLLLHLVSRLYELTPIIVITNRACSG